MADEKSRKPLATALSCAVIGVSIYFVTYAVLDFFFGGPSDATQASWGEPGPIEFGPEVTNEADPHRADLLAAAHLVRERWSYLEYRREAFGFDLDALLRECEELLGAEPTAKSFRKALRRFAAGLRDGHAFARFPGPDVDHTRRLPFSLIDVTEGLLIDGVAEGVQGVERGALLLALDDVPVEKLLHERERFVCASTPGSRRRRALYALVHDQNRTSCRFRIEDLGGATREHELELPARYVQVPSPGALPATRTHRWAADGIGYFRPGHFVQPKGGDYSGASPEERARILEPACRDFEKRLSEFADARGLVLDLRGNPGGTDLLGQFLVDRLVRPGYVYFRLSARGASAWRDYSSHESSAPQSELRLDLPLAVLIDAGTFSTADNVATCLHDVHPNVVFVGRPNGAGTGAPRPFALPRTGAVLTFCTQRVKGAKGHITEGRPIEPDLRIRWSRRDVLEGSDPDLRAALDRLAN